MAFGERTNEYMGIIRTGCEAIKKIKTFAERFLLSPDGVSYRLAKYLVADEGKLKWLGSLEDLKSFTKLSLCLDGKWSSPGGYAKSKRATTVWLCLVSWKAKYHSVLW